MAVRMNVLLVALDPGTAFSGCASSMPAATDVTVNQQYPDQPAEFIYCKQPSGLLYKKLCSGAATRRADWQFVATGHSVSLQLRSLPKSELLNYVTIDNPKLLLADPIPAYVKLPPGLQPLDVITDWLTSLKNVTRPHVQSVWGTYPGYDPACINWTITVPAIWSDAAKSVMRQAAHNAGIIPTYNSPFLQLRTEPESAAIAVLREHNQRLKAGDTLMVIDAGGGTVDFSLHTLRLRPNGDHSLEEDVKCDAVVAGACCVDDNFIKYLKKHLEIDDDTWDNWKETQPAQYRRLMYGAWEIAKRGFGMGGVEREMRIELPQTLQNLLDDEVEEGLDDGDLVIPSDAVKEEMFDPVIRMIINGAYGMLAPAGAVDYLFLAGGFSDNPYLRSCLEDELAVYSINGVMTCSNGGTAVMKGAVLAAKDPKLVAGRRAAVAYGVQITAPWAEGMPGKEWDDRLGKYMCYDVFWRFVKAGQLVAPDDEVTHTFHPLHVGATRISFKIYTTNNNESSYTTEPGMVNITKAVLVLPEPCRDPDTQRLRCKMTFGQTELRVTAVDVASGREVETEPLVFLTN